MTRYLAGVLTVIAAGVLLVAYGLFNPRALADQPMTYGSANAASPAPQGYSTIPVGYVPAGTIGQSGGSAVLVPFAQPVNLAQPVSYAQPVNVVSAPAPRAVRTVEYEQPVSRRTSRVVTRAPKKDWKRAAMIIGGSSATGAGVGAIFGGKKGALIGAAIAGGASTIYQSAK